MCVISSKATWVKMDSVISGPEFFWMITKQMFQVHVGFDKETISSSVFDWNNIL